MSIETTRAVAVGATVLAVLIGAALTIAILGALFAPVLAVLAAIWATFMHTGRATGRHGYNVGQARSEGIRKAGQVYRLTGRGWVMVR